MTDRLFDADAAEAALPMLRELLPRIRESRRALIESSARITEAVQADGGGVAGGDWFAAQRVAAHGSHRARRRGDPAARPGGRGSSTSRLNVRAGECSCAGGSARTGLPGSTMSTPGSRTGSRCDRPSDRRGGRSATPTRRLPASRGPARPSSCDTRPTPSRWREASPEPTRCSSGDPTAPGSRTPGPHRRDSAGSSRHRRGRRAAVPRTGRERRRRHERPGCVRRADRGMGDRRDARVRDRIAPLDPRSTARRVDRPADLRSGSREPGSWSSARARSAEPPPPVRWRSACRSVSLAVARDATRRSATCSASTVASEPRRSRPRARRAAVDRRDPRTVRRCSLRGYGPACPVLQRRARRHGRRAGARRGSAERHDRRRCARRLRDRAAASREPAVDDAQRHRLAPHQRRRRGMGARVVSLFVENARRFAAGEPLCEPRRQAGRARRR